MRGKVHEEIDMKPVIVKVLEGRIRYIFAFFDKATVCKSRLLVSRSVISFVSWSSVCLIVTDQEFRIPLYISRISRRENHFPKVFYHRHRSHLRISTNKDIRVSMLFPPRNLQIEQVNKARPKNNWSSGEQVWM